MSVSQNWRMEKMDDVIYFEDGDRVRKKVGNIDKIEDGLVCFTEKPSSEYMMIPIVRIVRIVRDKDGV